MNNKIDNPVLIDDEEEFMSGDVKYNDGGEDEKLLSFPEEDIHRIIQVLKARVLDRTAQLEAANKELEAFSYSISHDLRTPLRHISGFAGILMRDHGSQLSEPGIEYLIKIVSSVEKMEGLINDLLNFSKTGCMKFRKSPVKMSAIINDAILLVKPYTLDRQIEINISEMPEAYGNFNLLRQVWVNLLDNAVKYTRPRKITVISIEYRHEMKEDVFSIQDNGVGFDMQYAEKLFGVFQRMHLPEEFEGTGIGLANVRRIIARHGGRTWAEAEVDKGARFYFSLPAYQNLF